jgi:hypothetical protein
MICDHTHTMKLSERPGVTVRFQCLRNYGHEGMHVGAGKATDGGGYSARWDTYMERQVADAE